MSNFFTMFLYILYASQKGRGGNTVNFLSLILLYSIFICIKYTFSHNINYVRVNVLRASGGL